MQFSKVHIEAIGYELAPVVVTSKALEERLSDLYRRLYLQPGQLEALTGIRERRQWDGPMSMAEGAARAAATVLETSGVAAGEIDMVIYGGVCRDHLEPATSCEVADRIGVSNKTQIYDVSNACLGVMTGIVQAATAIELGQIRRALVVSCETSRQIVDLTIERMSRAATLEDIRLNLATLTGGSGAIAVLVSEASLAPRGHRILGGAIRSRAEHHRLCRWGPDTGMPATAPMQMLTDATAVLEHGVALGIETWRAFLDEMGWTAEQVDRTICHQVGAPHRDTVLKALEVPLERDFQTYEYLGNIGTVSLPITAAIADERGFLQSGHRVAFCGIGSGLNCLILGVQW